jgi:hypothetical protein
MVNLSNVRGTALVTDLSVSYKPKVINSSSRYLDKEFIFWSGNSYHRALNSMGFGDDANKRQPKKSRPALV